MKTYGSITYTKKKNRFDITCDPHVAIRLKRVFAKIDTWQYGTLSLSATPENCLDLQWFIERHPLLLSPDAEVRMTGEASKYKDQTALVDRLLSGQEPITPFSLKIPPRPYQSIATQLWIANNGLLLADDVGLGKTAVSIAGLTDPRTLPALVVTLSHLPKQWEDEIHKFSDLTTHILKKGTPYDILKYTKGTLPDVFICNYHKLAGWAETLSPILKSLVVDECHELRHRDSQKYKAAKHISENVDYRLGLSVGADSLVLLRGGAFGSGWYGGIEEAFTKMAGLANPLDDNGYSLLPVMGLGIEARGWEDNTGFCWKPITTFIRHNCDKPVVSLVVRGHTLVTTEDHSLFTVVGSNLQAIRGDELNPQSLMPLDNGTNWCSLDEQYLDTFAALRLTNRTQVLVDTIGLTRHDLGLTTWQWQNTKRECKFGPRLSLDVFMKHRQTLSTPTGAYFSSRGGAHLIGDGRILLSNWAYILGFFLGDGWINKDSDQNVSSVSFSIDLSTYEKVVAELSKITETPLKFEEKKRSAEMVELKCCNAFFAQILYAAFGGKFNCGEKQIPAEWLTTWPLRARQQLMEGLLDSDGHQRASEYRYTTTSPKLAQSVSLLATSLGFSASFFKAPPRLGGVIDGRQIVGSRNKYDVYWSTGDAHRGVSTQYKPQELWNQAPISKIETGKYSGYVYDLEMEGHPSFVLGGCSVLGHNSATPIYNFGGEIYNVIDILTPGSLGTWAEFEREWCTYQDQKPRIKDPSAFGSYAAATGLMLRRTRKDVKRELPEVTSVPHFIEADLKVLDSMKGQAVELAKLILKQGGQDFKGQKMQAAGQFDLKMRQATGISKALYAAEFIRMLVETSGEPVLVGLWHREVYSILMDELKDFNPVMFSGTESAAQKEVAKQKFISGEAKVMLLSLRSGAGMDGLQDICHLVVFAELDWTHSALKQFIGRVHRDGQDDPVTVYYLLSEHGSDPIMSDLLGIKKQQLEGIINPHQTIVEELQATEDYIKKMATKFLTDHGIEIPKHDDTIQAGDAGDDGEDVQRTG